MKSKFFSSNICGYLAGAASAVTFGLNPLFGLHLYAEGLKFGSVLFYRFLFATLLLGTAMLIRKKSFRIPKSSILPLFGLGTLLASTCLGLFISFHLMNAGIASTLLFLYPILVAVIMALFFHEKPGKATVAGIFIATAGVAVLCRPNGNIDVSLGGLISIFISALAWAIYIILLKSPKFRKIESDALTFYAFIFTFPAFLVVLRGGTDLQMLPSWNALANAIGLAFFPSFLSFFFSAISVRRIGATKTAVIGALEPLTAVFVGAVAFGDKITLQLAVGIILILTAVSIVVGNSSNKPADDRT